MVEMTMQNITVREYANALCDIYGYGYNEAVEMIDQNIVEREMREEVLDFYNVLEGSVDGYGKVTI
jgi:hypothetical protein